MLAGNYVTLRPGPILKVDTNVELESISAIGPGARLLGIIREPFATEDRKKNAVVVVLPGLISPLLSHLHVRRSCQVRQRC
jgi:hypothetical protein